jgi:hypothetical protein
VEERKKVPGTKKIFEGVFNMKHKNGVLKIRTIGIAVMVAAIGFTMAGCNDGSTPSGDKPKQLAKPSGLTISGTSLTWNAVNNASGYSVQVDGNEPVNNGNSTSYSLASLDFGTYSIKVKAKGNGKKYTDSAWSEAKIYEFDDPGLPDLDGNVTIAPATATVCVDTELTAEYDGSEDVSFQWEKDGVEVGEDSDTFTPTETGSYTVTVSMAGYNSKTSTAVEVTGHDYDDWEATTSTSFIESYEETGTCKHESSHTDTRTVDPLPITSDEEWTTAVSQIGEKENAGEYTLTIEGDVGVAGKTTATFGTTATGNSLSVTLKGDGKLYLTEQGNLIRIDARQKLIIDSEDLTLEGLTNNNQPLVYVLANGRLELEKGTITGNTSTTTNGGGVYVTGANSTFTMNGGKISDNTSSPGNAYYGSGGGGVYVGSGGTFTMYSGEISGNKVISAQCGGVFVDYNSTFTMNGGKISGNVGSNWAGGVYVYTSNGTFIMNNGEISGNKGVYSGGVGVNDGTFRMSNGTIYGNETTVDESLRNTASSGSGAALYKSGTATYGPSGTGTDLTTTNGTINVKDGVLVPLGTL